MRRKTRPLVVALASTIMTQYGELRAQETITFPGRSSDLAEDSYWT